MSQNNIRTEVENACNLEGQPLSKLSIEDIVNKYVDSETRQGNPRLYETLLLEQNQLDFQTKFLKDHSHIITLPNRNNLNIRSCNNVGSEVLTNKPIYVFLPGLGGSLDQYEPLLRLMDILNEKFIGFDLPGFGGSEEDTSEGGYNMIKVCHIINEALQSIITQNYSTRDTIELRLVGHSMGCYLVLHFFNSFQTKTEYKISQLILTSPPKKKIEPLDKNNRLNQFGLQLLYKLPIIQDFYRSWFDQPKGLKSVGIANFFYDTKEDTNNLSRLYRKLWQFYNNLRVKSSSIAGYLLGWEDLPWDELNDNLSTIDKIKIIIISGNEDYISPIKDVIEFQNSFRDIENVQLICIDNCGHNLCFDKPEVVCKILQDIATNTI
ncbi:hypothetical protein TBLA_0H03540 [Henningerozyma blattae CBS 6284]|uniref:AB hydrolase-1 domain-containing protein n=1 Tax=Henningerozyma blattae (strain ATCC 34711 / CBS 6284 / DSM 70876 / NBRC 10599 / NRRL Y-10934 / UCD 77-7) TaxID=1071380 RepID=I2H8D3_HENB6|nr:hypothetical protein TBLA_0H03540 [Tetrapisispora blattae CBS 6284]CCH62635.1 hypothetical protein TBLA_0H03540 [Tetrapisispora blattae CBS 6284]